MVRVDEDHLVPLLHPVFAHPVGVQYLHVGVLSARPLLGYPLEALSCGDLVRSHVLGPSSADVPRLPTAAAPHLHPHHADPLLSLVAEGPSPIEPGGPVDLLDGGIPPPSYQPLLPKLADVALTGGLPRVADVCIKRLQSLHLDPVRPSGATFRTESPTQLIGDKPFPSLSVRHVAILVFHDRLAFST